MNYEEIKAKYQGVAIEKATMRNRLTTQVEGAKCDVKRIQQELASLRCGVLDAEASQKAMSLQKQLNEAKCAMDEAQKKLNEFNDGGVSAEALKNMFV